MRPRPPRQYSSWPPRREPVGWWLLAVVAGVLGLAAAGVEAYAWWTLAHSAGHPPGWVLWILLLTRR